MRIFTIIAGIILLIILIGMLMPATIHNPPRDIAKVKLRLLSDVIIDYKNQYNSFPSKQDFSDILKNIIESKAKGDKSYNLFEFNRLTIDGWEKSFKYNILNKDNFAVISSAYDGIFEAKDDIISINSVIYYKRGLKKVKKEWGNKLYK